MFARALIVLLIAINLGVAVWWVSRPEPPAPRAAVQPPGVPRLQLLAEARPASVRRPTTIAPADPTAAASSTTAAKRCFSLGPFLVPDELPAVIAWLRPQVKQVRSRTVSSAAPRGYDVVIPPLASRELAQAAAQKISAAGFNDYLLINEGAGANGIALGRYGSRESAQRRQVALQAAGFEAQVLPIRDPSAPTWLDVEAADGFDIDRARKETGAAQSPALECANLR